MIDTKKMVKLFKNPTWSMGSIGCVIFILLFMCIGFSFELLISVGLIGLHKIYTAYPDKKKLEKQMKKEAERKLRKSNKAQAAIIEKTAKTLEVSKNISVDKLDKATESSRTPSKSDSKEEDGTESDSLTNKTDILSTEDKKKKENDEKGIDGNWRRADKIEIQPKPEPIVKPTLFGRPKTPHLKWRGLINKFTPEKFDKLILSFFETLQPNDSLEKNEQMVKDVIDLIFEAASKQHQYSQMYCDLCKKLKEHIETFASDFQFSEILWNRCHSAFLQTVTVTEKLPTNLDDEELMDWMIKKKQIMLGTVKFSGDLVANKLVNCNYVMDWITELITCCAEEISSMPKEATEEEKTEECKENVDEPSKEVVEDTKVEETRPAKQSTIQQQPEREKKIEVLCACLTSMGRTLNDPKMWAEEQLVTLQNVFSQLEILTSSEHLSSRIKYLIKDVLELRKTSWISSRVKITEKPRKLTSINFNLGSKTVQGCPQARTTSGDENCNEVVDSFIDGQALNILKQVTHNTDILESQDGKIHRLKTLIQLYHVIDNQSIVILGNTQNFPIFQELMTIHFQDIRYGEINNKLKKAHCVQILKDYDNDNYKIIYVGIDTAMRNDIKLNTDYLLINFDMGLSTNGFLYRLEKWAKQGQMVYSFLNPHTDKRRTLQMITVLENTNQKIPQHLKEIANKIPKTLMTSIKENSNNSNQNRNEISDNGNKNNVNKVTDSQTYPNRVSNQSSNHNKNSSAPNSAANTEVDWRARRPEPVSHGVASNDRMMEHQSQQGHTNNSSNHDVWRGPNTMQGNMSNNGNTSDEGFMSMQLWDSSQVTNTPLTPRSPKLDSYNNNDSKSYPINDGSHNNYNQYDIENNQQYPQQNNNIHLHQSNNNWNMMMEGPIDQNQQDLQNRFLREYWNNNTGHISHMHTNTSNTPVYPGQSTNGNTGHPIHSTGQLSMNTGPNNIGQSSQNNISSIQTPTNDTGLINTINTGQGDHIDLHQGQNMINEMGQINLNKEYSNNLGTDNGQINQNKEYNNNLGTDNGQINQNKEYNNNLGTDNGQINQNKEQRYTSLPPQGFLTQDITSVPMGHIHIQKKNSDIKKNDLLDPSNVIFPKNNFSTGKEESNEKNIGERRKYVPPNSRNRQNKDNGSYNRNDTSMISSDSTMNNYNNRIDSNNRNIHEQLHQQMDNRNDNGRFSISDNNRNINEIFNNHVRYSNNHNRLDNNLNNNISHHNNDQQQRSNLTNDLRRIRNVPVIQQQQNRSIQSNDTANGPDFEAWMAQRQEGNNFSTKDDRTISKERTA